MTDDPFQMLTRDNDDDTLTDRCRWWAELADEENIRAMPLLAHDLRNAAKRLEEQWVVLVEWCHEIDRLNKAIDMTDVDGSHREAIDDWLTQHPEVDQ